MNQVRSAGPQASLVLSGRLAGPFKDLLWKRAQQQDYMCWFQSGKTIRLGDFWLCRYRAGGGRRCGRPPVIVR